MQVSQSRHNRMLIQPTDALEVIQARIKKVRRGQTLIHGPNQNERRYRHEEFGLARRRFWQILESPKGSRQTERHHGHRGAPIDWQPKMPDLQEGYAERE